MNPAWTRYPVSFINIPGDGVCRCNLRFRVENETTWWEGRSKKGQRMELYTKIKAEGTRTEGSKRCAEGSVLSVCLWVINAEAIINATHHGMAKITLLRYNNMLSWCPVRHTVVVHTDRTCVQGSLVALLKYGKPSHIPQVWPYFLHCVACSCTVLVFHTTYYMVLQLLILLL